MGGCSGNDGGQGGMEELCSWPPREGIRHQEEEEEYNFYGFALLVVHLHLCVQVSRYLPAQRPCVAASHAHIVSPAVRCPLEEAPPPPVGARYMS